MRAEPQAVRVSFDIDDTLVCNYPGVPAEKTSVPGMVCGCFGEPLRRAACSLMRELRSRGCSIWICTTSGRSAFQIRLWLFLYGIRVDGVVNDERHRRVVSRRGFSRLPSKYPPTFGIDLHVDNSEGVRVAASRVDSPFFTADTVLRRDGITRIIELGDGQVSDRKKWSAVQLLSVFEHSI